MAPLNWLLMRQQRWQQHWQQKLLREQELEQARVRGRWLSDEEQLALRQQQQRQLQRQQRLSVALLVSLLLPLFWPLAPLLAGWLWFPRTTGRLLMAMTLLALLLLVALVLLLRLLFWL